jgi:hypothetical protein
MPDNSYAFVRFADIPPNGLAELDSMRVLSDTAASAGDLEVHRIHGDDYLFGFVTIRQASMLRYTRSATQLTLYTRGSSIAPCAVDIPAQGIRILGRTYGEVVLSGRFDNTPIVHDSTSGCAGAAQAK